MVSGKSSLVALLGTGVTLAQISTLVTICVGVATFLYVTIQAGYLLWKWWKEAHATQRLVRACRTCAVRVGQGTGTRWEKIKRRVKGTEAPSDPRTD